MKEDRAVAILRGGVRRVVVRWCVAVAVEKKRERDIAPCVRAPLTLPSTSSLSRVRVTSPREPRRYEREIEKKKRTSARVRCSKRPIISIIILAHLRPRLLALLLCACDNAPDKKPAVAAVAGRRCCCCCWYSRYMCGWCGSHDIQTTISTYAIRYTHFRSNREIERERETQTPCLLLPLCVETCR